MVALYFRWEAPDSVSKKILGNSYLCKMSAELALFAYKRQLLAQNPDIRDKRLLKHNEQAMMMWLYLP